MVDVVGTPHDSMLIAVEDTGEATCSGFGGIGSYNIVN